MDGSRASILVAGLLVVCILYPGALVDPYHQSAAGYSIAADSTEAYDAFVEEHDVDTDDPTPVAELSPSTRQAFEEATQQPPADYEEYPDRWHRLGSVPICNAWLLYCDEYETEPEFPLEWYDSYDGYGVVESDDGVYLVQTSTGTMGLVGIRAYIELIVRFAILTPYAGFLALASRDVSERRLYVYSGCGALLLILSLALPYIIMGTTRSFNPVQWFAIGGLSYVACAVGTVDWIIQSRYRSG